MQLSRSYAKPSSYCAATTIIPTSPTAALITAMRDTITRRSRETGRQEEEEERWGDQLAAKLLMFMTTQITRKACSRNVCISLRTVSSL